MGTLYPVPQTCEEAGKEPSSNMRLDISNINLHHYIKSLKILESLRIPELQVRWNRHGIHLDIGRRTTTLGIPLDLNMLSTVSTCYILLLQQYFGIWSFSPQILSKTRWVVSTALKSPQLIQGLQREGDKAHAGALPWRFMQSTDST